MQAARLPLQREIRDRGSLFVRQGAAEREKEGSAAKSIQRMSALAVVPYRGTTALPWHANAQRGRILRSGNRDLRIWRHRAPTSWFGRGRLRAESCSIATARAPVFALPVWNETGTRLARNQFSLRAQRTRNDSRSRTRNRSQSQPPCSASVHSYSVSGCGVRGRGRALKAMTCPQILPVARPLKLFLRNQGSARSLRRVYFLAGQRRE